MATLAELSKHRPVLAAGDFNESLRDDLWPDGSTRGTWAREYFTRVKELGFVSPLHFAWLEEVPTRGLLQLDHVLLSKKRADLVPTDPSPAIDPLWQTPRAADLSDHAAVWFTINI